MVLEKGSIHLQNSVIIYHTISCNISLYRDTNEVIYRYTQNVYRCISSVCMYVCMYVSTVITVVDKDDS